ncbi:hypothetical protein LTS18_010569, partial [Coniosporium uncinatum]
LMGSPIQISVTEILQSLERAKKVYDSFNDEFDSADNRIKELFGTSQLLHGVLAESEELLLRCNRTFPAHESFIKKLRELDRFIDKYSTLRPSEGSGNGSQGNEPGRMKRYWQITRFAFDDAEELKNGLQLEMQQLVTFVLLLAL